MALLLHVVVLAILFVILNDDQLSLQGAHKLPALPASILRCLEAHEDGCDWLSGIQGVEDGVRGVVSIEGGVHSIRGGGAVVQSSAVVEAALCLRGWAVTVTFCFINTDVITKLWLVGCD